MDLESRVAALETELADFHAGNDSQHHDMRVEYRGWAEHAVHAHEKLTTAKEMMHLILTDVREIKETHGQKLDHLSTKVDTLSTTVDQHTATLDQHTATLDLHTRILGEHSQKLDEHDRKLDNLTTTVDSHTTLLREILAKVS
jgi:ABC-type transporter Mla subunit MlaD